jgi:LmbE family N-acetylglucosaminyl deacetylase
VISVPTDAPRGRVEPSRRSRRVVVVAPHPDDEVLGTGLLLARLAKVGLPTTFVAVTDGEGAYADQDPDHLAALRRAEQAAALRLLGHGRSPVVRLGLPDGRVGDHLDALTSLLTSIVDAETLLVAPSSHDWHPDHVACGAGARATAATTGCERWSSLFWAHHYPESLAASRPALFELRGSRHEQAARARALECHRSQFERRSGTPILDRDLVEHLTRPVETFVDEP